MCINLNSNIIGTLVNGPTISLMVRVSSYSIMGKGMRGSYSMERNMEWEYTHMAMAMYTMVNGQMILNMGRVSTLIWLKMNYMMVIGIRENVMGGEHILIHLEISMKDSGNEDSSGAKDLFSLHQEPDSMGNLLRINQLVMVSCNMLTTISIRENGLKE